MPFDKVFVSFPLMPGVTGAGEVPVASKSPGSDPAPDGTTGAAAGEVIPAAASREPTPGTGEVVAIGVVIPVLAAAAAPIEPVPGAGAGAGEVPVASKSPGSDPAPYGATGAGATGTTGAGITGASRPINVSSAIISWTLIGSKPSAIRSMLIWIAFVTSASLIGPITASIITPDD